MASPAARVPLAPSQNGLPGEETLPFFLIFVPIYLRGALLQETAPERQRKPFLERLCRLEAQFWRFQKATLKHLQGIASNYNLSFVMEAWFWSLAHESQAVALALSQLQAAVQGDLGHLKTWVWKTQCRGQKVDNRLLALGAALSERSTQERKGQEEQRNALSGWPWTLQRGPCTHLSERVHCECDLLPPGFFTGLRALSVCSWVRTALGHLGTLLSYTSKENDKLVLHGRDSLPPGSTHSVIGDPAFRELPLQPLPDGCWHHVCVIWTSILGLGRYWLHMSRRLVATGSRFGEGYEIPPGGSLMLGQEHDSIGGGFDGPEAFVGSLACLAIWHQVLVPREVSNLATGKEFLMGAILTLANAASVDGFVQRVNCTCLQLCS
ncbi:hypothetical protein EI555_020044 [Monodon monoceros]|uniref:Pentraxin (PTX) domain-containing protein n=1 Tax=Monodon monoceros TaxID=40151 RepID=A0A4U1FN19_MONMO|nr:hypothetical protein EI555_020044 [Monodon monoceros]